MKKSSLDILILCCGMCAAVFVFAAPVPPAVFSSLSDLPAWYSHKSVPGQRFSTKVVAIAVDEKSLRQVNQRWPLRRDLYARLVQQLSAEGARVIAFDLFFQGESADVQDDRFFSEALRASRARTVVGYTYDARTATLNEPLAQIKDAASLSGLLYAPLDPDQKVRRSRAAFKTSDNRQHFSFSTAVAAAYLGVSPQDLLARFPLSRDGTFRIRFFLRPGSTSLHVVSLIDLLDHPQTFDRDLLKDSLCLVYPAAEINHDIYQTPAGMLDGGLLQLNAAATMIADAGIIDFGLLTFFLLLLSFLLVYCIASWLDVSDLRSIVAAAFLVFGVVFLLDYWAQVFFNSRGVAFDYGRVSFFAMLFFIAGWFSKYTLFLVQLVSIKTKATLDPVRQMYSLRYFSYRLDIEARKTFFGRSLFLVVLHFGGLRRELEDADMLRVKDLWGKLAAVLRTAVGFWGVFSQDEVVGAFICPSSAAEPLLRRIAASLQAAVRNGGFAATVRGGYVEVKKEYPLGQLVRVCAELLRTRTETLTCFGPEDFTSGLMQEYAQSAGQERFGDSLAEDIEEKNRELESFYAQLKKEHARSKEAFFQIIESLVNALEARDPYTQGHSQRVADYSVRLAGELGWPNDELEKLRRAALLHDLGKIGIPDTILHKQGSLSVEEFDLIKKHEVIAVSILKPLKEFEEILPWILYHHERWDGKGYPHGLGGAGIPLASRILSLADVFDALTTGRDYKKALNREDTLRILREGKNSQFDPELTERFIEMITRQQPQK